MSRKFVINSVGVWAAVMLVLLFASNAPAPVAIRINVTKTCTNASSPGQPINFSATVSNTGGDDLKNITCTDDPVATLIDVPTLLSVGQSVTFTGSYVPTTNPSTDTITCSGESATYPGTFVSASASATCSTPTEEGCTLTPGYWKTHSAYGPAPYDDTWAKIGENKLFFLSGKSYHEVLWTNPKGGNAYYILAHQFIAAQLNVFIASVPPSVTAAISEVAILFGTYLPDDIAALRGDDAIRAQFITYAGLLDAYNSGIIGPGHCPF